MQRGTGLAEITERLGVQACYAWEPGKTMSVRVTLVAGDTRRTLMMTDGECDRLRSDVINRHARGTYETFNSMGLPHGEILYPARVTALIIGRPPKL
jgi:hypothetical protein